jgi:GNAT superfamily N-acetyltransferase
MTSAELWPAIEASWPAAHSEPIGPFTWRDGAGGGSRVSAATAKGPVNKSDLETIEHRFLIARRDALFQIRTGDQDFDALLEHCGYEIADRTVCLAASVDRFAPLDPDKTYTSWPPIAAQRNIWHAGGVGPARLDVMNRVQIPKTTILVRNDEAPSGTAFVASLGSISLVHALEISPDFRRKGSAASLMSHAAAWSKDAGADTLCVLVTRANTPALALYSSLGMKAVDEYHYRRKGQS